MKVLELFAGIGACSSALDRLGIEHEIVDAVEIDKYAIQSFNAIHGTNFEVQDICTWDKDLSDIDLIMHGSPCQDFSIAGQQAGGDIGSGTRSSLMYETVRIVGKIRPKYVIWENVKNILSAKHRHNFDNYLNALQSLGYNNYYQVLNAKDYGIPQNRERVFTISIRNDIDSNTFQFPEKQELKLRLKDMMEENVDEKYYLSKIGVEYFKKQAENREENLENYKEGRLLTVAHGQSKGSNKNLDISPTLDTKFSTNWRGVITEPKCEQVGTIEKEGWIDQMKRVYSTEGLAPTIPTCQGGNTEPKILEEPQVINPLKGDSVNLAYPESETRRGRVGNQVAQTLQCNDSMGVVTAEVINPSPKLVGGIGEKNFGSQYRQGNRIYDSNEIAMALTSNPVGNSGGNSYLYSVNDDTCEELEHKELIEDEIRDNINDMLWRRGLQKEEKGQLRIRKLTPKECWRLMGFTDEEFDKVQNTGISNTQLYKQAGNSIVVNVLVEIFKNLFSN